MKIRVPILLILLWGTHCSHHSRAETVVIPKELEEKEGPFTEEPFRDRSRHHYLFGQSLFLESMPEGAVITGLAMRVDELNTVRSAQVSITMSLSTHPVLPFHLSTRFGENIGSDAKTVFRGPLSVIDSAPGQGLKPFDALIPFESPFFYDPRNGNLLLDVTAPIGANGLYFDMFQSSNVASILGGIGTNSGLLAGDVALVLQFNYVPVPEPSILAICTVFVGALFFQSRK